MNPFYLCWFVAIKDLSLPPILSCCICCGYWRKIEDQDLLFCFFSKAFFSPQGLKTQLTAYFLLPPLKYIGVEILVVAVMNMFLRSVADSEISKSADPEHVYLWRRVPLRAPSHYTTSTLLNASASWQTICLTHSQSVRQTWMPWSEQLFCDLWKSDQLREIEMDT